MPKLSAKRSAALLRDLLAASHDLVSLAREHRLSPKQLADWIGCETNRVTLQNLRLLADMQTQLLLSRYRLHAAARLVGIAGDQEQEADLSRKACVDMFKIESVVAGTEPAPTQPATPEELAQARRELYGDMAAPDAGPRAPAVCV